MLIPVVILCGGDGLRFTEANESDSKVMALIGDRPILWHIMKHYSKYDVNRFILCVKDSDTIIQAYFAKNSPADWNIEVVKTGDDTPTAGRILKIKDWIESPHFFVTYGDGLADVNIKKLLAHHIKQNLSATLTAIHPNSQYGFVKLDAEEKVKEFVEKPMIKEWVNGGYFVFKKSIFDTLIIKELLETDVLPRLAKEGQLTAYKHNGFWKSMDTRKEHVELNELHKSGRWPI